MIEWLKSRDWFWTLYFEWGFQPDWLPVPELREWRILLLDGMDPPPERPGYAQRIVRLPRVADFQRLPGWSITAASRP